MKESAVTVIGGGTMGRENPFVAAMSGFSTYLVDVESRFLDNAREQLVKSTDRMVERQIGRASCRERVEAADVARAMRRTPSADGCSSGGDSDLGADGGS